MKVQGYDWKEANAQHLVRYGNFACYASCVTVVLGVSEASIRKLFRSISNDKTSCKELEGFITHMLEAGSALAIAIRMHLSATTILTVDHAQVITPDGFRRFLEVHTTVLDEFQVAVASGMVLGVDYSTQMISLRSPGVLDDLGVQGKFYQDMEARGVYTEAISVKDLIDKCYTIGDCILHLTLDILTDSESACNVSEVHTTLLIKLSDDWCCHVDTFPGVSIRIDEDEKRMLRNKSRLRFQSSHSFYQWFVATYIPARTPFILEAIHVSSN